MDNRLPAGVTGNEPIFQDSPVESMGNTELLQEYFEAMSDKDSFKSAIDDLICNMDNREALADIVGMAVFDKDIESRSDSMRSIRDEFEGWFLSKASEWKEEALSEARFD